MGDERGNAIPRELYCMPLAIPIGTQMLHATGLAWAAKYRGEKRLACTFFGDGATNIGAFHEGLNLASIWKLPVIFICDNNVYGEYSRIHTTTPIEDLHMRAESYNMPHFALDGMDVSAVQAGISEAVERARTGGGPTLIEAKTYRFSGHSRTDQALYRPAGELEKWLERDPIKVTEDALVNQGILNHESIQAMKSSMKVEIANVIATCTEASEPSLAAMFENIWTPAKGSR